MSIRVTCPKCRAAFTCPDEYRGRTLRCKKCGQPFVAAAAAPRQAEPPTRRGLTPRRFAVAAVVAVLLGVGIGLPAAWVLLKKHHHSDEIAAAPPTGTTPVSPPVVPPPTPKPEPPRDTAPKPPPVVRPVEWTEYTSRAWGFGARFPGEPKSAELPSVGGKRSQTFEASAPAAPGRNPVTVSVACAERDAGETADPTAFLEARAAEVGRDVKASAAPKLSGFAGVEVRGGDPAGDWLTTHRFYVVRARSYHVVAEGPADKESAALARQFLDSFALLDPGPPEPVKPTPPPEKPPVVVKPGPPKGGLAELQLTAPHGWEANYNKFLGGTGGWELKKPPPTARSEGENVRIEPCPADAAGAADYAAHLKEKDWLNVDVPGFVEVGPKEDLPDGFVIKGVVKKFANPKTPPVLGFVAVRDIAGLKVRCWAADLRSADSLGDALEAFKTANFAAPK